jgi:hypothetical protein
MSGLEDEDFRDLNDPYNFVNRSPEDRRNALVYFLRSGAVSAFQTRISIARQYEPSYVPELYKADLINMCLWGANLAKADLREAQLAWADLKNSVLSGADLSGANLVGADLRGAYLNNAIFAGADIRGANFEGSSIAGCDFSTALQGEITPELARENPNYRTPAPPRRRKVEDNGPAPGSLAEGLSTASYSGPKRDYTGGQKAGGDAKGPSLAEQAENEKEEASKKKKEDLKKFQKKKKQTEKFFSKKKMDQKKFLEKKKQNEQAYKRKQEEAKKKK